MGPVSRDTHLEVAPAVGERAESVDVSARRDAGGGGSLFISQREIKVSNVRRGGDKPVPAASFRTVSPDRSITWFSRALTFACQVEKQSSAQDDRAGNKSPSQATLTIRRCSKNSRQALPRRLSLSRSSATVSSTGRIRSCLTRKRL